MNQNDNAILLILNACFLIQFYKQQPKRNQNKTTQHKQGAYTGDENCFLFISVLSSSQMMTLSSFYKRSFRKTKSSWAASLVKLSSQLPYKFEAVVVKTDLYITGSGECVCLVNLIKQQVQKSGHMALMCPVRG